MKEGEPDNEETKDTKLAETAKSVEDEEEGD